MFEQPDVAGIDAATTIDVSQGYELGAASFAQELSPVEAHRLASEGAVLIDVRTHEELKAIGSIPGSLHIPWQLGAARTKNPRFLKDLSARISADKQLLFICRSGRRSHDAALAAVRAGYAQSHNIVEGVEGSEDGPGWIARGLPIQRG